MRLRFLVVSLLLAFLLLSGTAFSQTFTGSIDGYYQWNLNKPANQFTPARAFDFNHQMFSLNYAELSVEQKGKPVGYRFDVGAGDAAKVVAGSGNDAGSSTQYIQQAYVTVNHDKMALDFGKFVTPLGAEVIETKDNWNYSRGLLFTYAVPFYHFGIRATYTASDKLTAAFYVVNGWNDVLDNNRGKSFGIMVTAKPLPKLTMTENYLVGNESPVKDNRRHALDSITTYEVSKKLSAMANYDYVFDTSFSARRRLQGIALYTKISPNGKDTGFKIVPRYEWMEDRNGAFTNLGSGADRIHEGTLTFQVVTKDSGTFWAESRRDFANQKVFFLSKPKSLPTVYPRFNQDTIEFGYTYSFMKEVK